MKLVVATVGRAQGLKGEVALLVRTDDPDRRLAVGSTLASEDGSVQLTLTRVRHQHEKWFATFAEAADRTSAEALRGTELVVDADASDEDDAWYPHELVGLRVELLDGTVVGEVRGLDHLPAQDVLVVRETQGERTLIPFVRQIVPVVDVPGGRVVVDPPGGLLARDTDALEIVLPEPGPDHQESPDGRQGEN